MMPGEREIESDPENRDSHAAESLATDDRTPLESGFFPSKGRRKRPTRSRTIRVHQLRLLHPEDARPSQLPRSRAECESGPRPCPFVSCKHHLYLDVSPATGAIKLNFPDLEVWELAVSCALDIADEGGLRLEDVGDLLNVTRERARQIEATALRKLATSAKKLGT